MNLKRDKWNECDLDPNAADLTEETHYPKVDTKDVLHDDTSLRTSVLFMGQTVRLTHLSAVGYSTRNRERLWYWIDIVK